MKSITHYLTLFAAGAIGLIVALPTYADSCGLRHKFERLERRMDRGIDSGQLTKHEVHRLKRERREIRALARDFRDDGYLSRRECDILASRVERLSHHISRLKHNDRTRYDYSYRDNRSHYDSSYRDNRSHYDSTYRDDRSRYDYYDRH